MRVKHIRAVPEPLVALQMPGAEHDLRSDLDLAVSECFGFQVFAHHHRHRRVQPERLAEHVAREGQLGQVGEGKADLAASRLCLCRDAVLRRLIDRQQIQRPGQRGGRCFMACEKKDRHLIDHFRAVKRLPGYRIDRCHDLGRQIIGRSAGGYFRGACFGQLGQQRADFCAGLARGLALKPRHPARFFQK